MTKEIIKAWNMVGSPTSFGGIAAVKNYFGTKYTVTQIKNALSKIPAYNSSRRNVKTKKFIPYVVFTLRELFQCDLIELGDLSAQNNGFRYILTCCDTLSRYLWAELLKDKKAVTVELALKKIFTSLTEKPQRLLTDKGLEFTNKTVQNMLKDLNIRFSTPKTSDHCGTIERINKTLQSLLYKYMEANETRTFFKNFDLIVMSYNERKNRVINMSPREAEREKNYPVLIERVLNNYFARTSKSKAPKFKKGDLVKLLLSKTNLFRRGYQRQWTQEIFEVVGLRYKQFNYLYYVQSRDATPEAIEGGFYANELLKISKHSIKP